MSTPTSARAYFVAASCYVFAFTVLLIFVASTLGGLAGLAAFAAAIFGMGFSASITAGVKAEARETVSDV